MRILRLILYWLTFGPIRTRKDKERRRANYEFLKAQISERHFAGFAGLTVDFGRKFDWTDMACFRAPMYAAVKNTKGQFCIFWDRGKLTQEIGTGAPLRQGEVLIDEPGRTKPQETIETINHQAPLTVQVEPEKS